MDVNFDTGNISNGALSANTSDETWVVVFDGKINAGIRLMSYFLQMPKTAYEYWL